MQDYTEIFALADKTRHSIESTIDTRILWKGTDYLKDNGLTRDFTEMKKVLGFTHEECKICLIYMTL